MQHGADQGGFRQCAYGGVLALVAVLGCSGHGSGLQLLGICPSRARHVPQRIQMRCKVLVCGALQIWQGVMRPP